MVTAICQHPGYRPHRVVMLHQDNTVSTRMFPDVWQARDFVEMLQQELRRTPDAGTGKRIERFDIEDPEIADDPTDW